MRILPFGYNIFEFPRDNDKLFFTVRPTKYQNKVGLATIERNKKATARSKAKKNGTFVRPRSSNPKSIQQMSYENKKRKKPRKTSAEIAKKKKTGKDQISKPEAYQMARQAPRAQTSIRNMMGIKFNK
jgi:hypothetical protein